MKSPRKETSPKASEQYGFNAIHRLQKDSIYEGSADFVMLVWHENQIFPAEQYRKAYYEGKVVDIGVCEDPNIQKNKLGDRALIYTFGGASSGGGGKN